jgi:hypothetical protein
VLLLSTAPLAIVFGANAGISPLDPAIIARCLAGSLVLGGAAYAVTKAVIDDPAARSQWLSLVLLGTDAYIVVIKGARSAGADWHPGSPWVAAIYVLVVLGLATAIVRPWVARRRDLVPVLMIAVALPLANVYIGVSRMLASPTARWRPAADSLVAGAASAPRVQHEGARPDIYYIVLDAFGRPDRIKDDYGVDLSPFVTFLEARGFFVAGAAQSNYSQTFLALSSALNMSYLDAMAAAIGSSSTDHRPLEYLIQENALMKLAKRAGYRVVSIGSDTDTTQHIDQADVCVCGRLGLDSLEQAAIATTPFGALPLNRWTLDAHRRSLLRTFDAAANGIDGGGPTFYFVHVMAPHPPFVFGPGGRYPHQSGLGLFMFNDGDQFNSSTEEYVSGYREQVQFVAEKVEALVGALLSRSSRTPVILMHGDHGGGSKLHWDDAGATDMKERMTIFAAYLFPKGVSGLYPTITPVNAARLLASDYLDTPLAALPDRTLFSTLSAPYTFTAVLSSPR